MEEKLTTEFTAEQLEAEVKKLEEADKKEADTFVTSEAKLKEQGQQMPQLTAEQRLLIAGRNHIDGLRMLQENWKKLSAKGGRRVMVAILQLPEEGMKSQLQGDLERGLFQIGQMVLNSRALLVNNAIMQEYQRQRAEAKAKEQTTQKETENVNNTTEPIVPSQSDNPSQQ